MGALPFGLLVVALLVFLLSTAQWRFVWRIAIWLIGASLLLVTATLTSHDAIDSSLAQALSDLAGNATRPSDSVVWQALWGNQQTVSGSLVPMLDVFLFVSVALAFLSLVALTPGESIERVVRPMCFMLIGSVAGAVFALAVVAVGIGDYDKRRVYVGVVSTDDVIDGDTFRMGGEVSLRLDGVDAPELDQVCFRGDERRDCGIRARDALAQRLRGGIVICGRRGIDPEHRPSSRAPSESYSRPLVQCWVRTPTGDNLDVAQFMAANGHALAWSLRSGPYNADIALARSQRRGVWSTCTITPRAWRRESEAVAQFLENGAPSDPDVSVGICA